MHWVSWMQVGRRLTCLLAAVSSFASWLLLSTRFSSSSSSCFHCLLAQLKVFFSSFPPSANLGGPSSLPGLLPDSPIAWWLYGHSNYGWHGFRQLNVIPSLLNAILNLCTLCNTWYSIYNSVLSKTSVAGDAGRYPLHQRSGWNKVQVLTKVKSWIKVILAN